MNKIFGDTNITSSSSSSCNKSAAALNTHRFADNVRGKPRRKNRFKKKDAKVNFTHTNYTTGPSDQRKSFAEIVRNNADDCIVEQAIKPPNILPIEAGEVGALGYDFRTIENSSVRSVLENLFREPEQKSDAEETSTASASISFDLPSSIRLPTTTNNNNNNEVCSSCVQKQNEVVRPQPISMPPQTGTSILDNIFNEETTTYTNVQRNAPFTNGSSNIIDFNYNLSDLLYQRAKQPYGGTPEFSSTPADHPSAFFVCPRCGEMTNLQMSDLERLGSLGDRCIPNFNNNNNNNNNNSNRFQSNDIFSGQYSRRYTPIYNQSTASSNVFAFRKSVGRMNRANPFNGLNTRKKKSK